MNLGKMWFLMRELRLQQRWNWGDQHKEPDGLEHGSATLHVEREPNSAPKKPTLLIHSSVQVSSLLPLHPHVLWGCNFNVKVVPTFSYSSPRSRTQPGTPIRPMLETPRKAGKASWFCPLQHKIARCPTAMGRRKTERPEHNAASLDAVANTCR